jgi:hypothetical protein
MSGSLPEARHDGARDNSGHWLLDRYHSALALNSRQHCTLW